jgi:predicted S18 family serine protease
VIDLAPTDKKSIRRIAKAAERAVDQKDYPQARVLLASLASELRVRTWHLPLATYPEAMQEAAGLLQQKKMAEARVVLENALNTLVVIDRVRPLPIMLAQAAIDAAQQQRDKDKNAALQLLTTARSEVERARELGYTGNDPEYDALASEISDVERQIKSNGDSGGAFSRLKERMAALFKRHSESEKKSETASR